MNSPLKPSRAVAAVLLGTALISLACLTAYLTHPWIGNIAATLMLVIGVLIVGAGQGMLAGLVAAAVAFFFFNFFMAEPVLSLTLSSSDDIAPLVAFNVTALIAGALSGKLRDRAAAAERATGWANLLLEAGNEVQAAIDRQQIEDRLRDKALARLGLSLDFFLPTPSGRMPDEAPDVVHDAWTAMADCSSGASMALVMQGISGPIGVLVTEGPWASYKDFLGSYANLAAIALERAVFSERMREVRALERSEELKSALLSSVSHDFRTPLSAISASASSLREFEQQISAEQRDFFLATILVECNRLNNYTANLLEISKLESGSTPPAQILDINDVVFAVVGQPYIRSADRIIEINVPVGVLVRANAMLFELALSNIVTNSIDFSGPGSRILISAERIDSQIILEVKDEGSGIPAEDLTRVFDKFHRTTSAGGKSGGSGLGLAIARGFVVATGGSIWADSPGIGEKGATIGMNIPAVDLDPVDE